MCLCVCVCVCVCYWDIRIASLAALDTYKVVFCFDVELSVNVLIKTNIREDIWTN